MRKITGLTAVLAAGYLYAVYPGRRSDARIDALKRRKYYAHRGLHDAARGIPENSMEAFIRARDAGYGIELDVQLTKDGMPAVFHDRTIGRMTQGSGELKQYTYAELQEYPLMHTDSTIPLFAAVLDAIHGEVPLIVELKVHEPEEIEPLCKAVCALLDIYKGLYCLESFDPRAVYWLAKNRPDLIRGQLYESIYRDRGRWMYKASGNLLFSRLNRPDFIAFSADHGGILSRPLLHSLLGVWTVGWTVRSEEQLKKAEKKYDAFIFEGFCPDRM